MPAFVQATTPGLHSAVPASEDTRSPGTGPSPTPHALTGAVHEGLARWHVGLTARIEGWAGDRLTPGPHRKDRP